MASTSIEDVRAAAGVSGSQLYHYFDGKQALIRAVITHQAGSAVEPGQPRITTLDSFDALRAWADAAIERQRENGCRGECDLGSLAGELRAGDEASRDHLANGFLRWKDLILVRHEFPRPRSPEPSNGRPVSLSATRTANGLQPAHGECFVRVR